jgi:hypothetical protein
VALSSFTRLERWAPWPMTSAAKSKMNAIFRTAVQRAIKVGDTLHIVIGDTMAGVETIIEEKVKKALASGQTVVQDGVTTWVDYIEVVDRTKSGSDVYTWKGDKVKVEKMIVTKSRDGSITRTSAGFSWRNLD